MDKDLSGLSNELAAIATTQNKSNDRFNHASFLILRHQIDKAIEDGWSKKFIWETLHQQQKIRVGYQRFLKLVKRYTQTEQPYLKPNVEQKMTLPIKRENLINKEKNQKEAPIAEGFTYTTQYNKEELI
jgi:hypothetical protein